jgi:hypothetical protein
MATIAFPSTPGVAKIEWTPPAATSVNKGWSGKRRTTILPAPGRWKAKVTIVTVMGEAAFLAWRAFLMGLQGQANNFRLPAVEMPQSGQIAVRVDGAGQTGLSLATHGWTGSGSALKAGQLITVGDQLIGIGADVAISSGGATLALTRRLRPSPADDAAVEVRTPYGLMAATSDDLPWSVDPGQLYGLSFECEEDF